MFFYDESVPAMQRARDSNIPIIFIPVRVIVSVFRKGYTELLTTISVLPVNGIAS